MGRTVATLRPADRDDAHRLYRARPEGLREVRAFLDDFWDDKLEKLKREVERG